MGMTTKEYHEGYQQGYKDAKEEFKNTIRKYQKIEHIFLKWHDNWSYQASMAMSDIEKVVEENVD